MSSPARAAAVAAGASLAVALHWVQPALAVAGSVVALLAAVVGIAKLNTIHARLAYNVASVGYFATTYLGSGSLLLGLAALSTILLLLRFYETGARVSGDLGDFSPGVALILGLIFLLQAWPVGDWGWALAPGLLGSAVLTVASTRAALGNRRDYAAFRQRLSEGMIAPDFELPITAPSGEASQFALSARRGGWVLLFFLRGTWCPVCQMVARVYQKQQESLKQRGVELVVVSPTAGAETEAFARSLGLTFTIVHDERQVVADTYHAKQSFDDPRSKPVLPVAILVDPAGIIRHISNVDDPRLATDPAALDAILAQAAQAA